MRTLCLAALLATVAVPLAAQESTSDAPAPAAAPRAAVEQAADGQELVLEAARAAGREDLKQIQGAWQRTESQGFFGSRRILKEIAGDVETVTYFDAEGDVETANTAKVTLYRFGPVRVFEYSDYKYIAGPNAGQQLEAGGAYVYKLVDDEQTFLEIWGVLGDGREELNLMTWNRVPADD